jgi:hypothetical protein
VQFFPIIMDFLAQKVSSEDKVRLISDAISGYKDKYMLFNDTIETLHNGFFFFLLNQVSNEYSIDIWHQGWITIVSLGLIGEQINDRNAFLDHIKKGHIKLKEEPDSLALSKNKIRGEFTAKLG